jgi:hypothetical protein
MSSVSWLTCAYSKSVARMKRSEIRGLREGFPRVPVLRTWTRATHVSAPVISITNPA